MLSEKYILLVDDDEICHFLSRRVLSKLNYDGDIVDVSDGLKACEHIKKHGSPSLVLLDLRMPIMDGHEFLAALATGDLGVAPPVCVVTSSARMEDQQLDKEYTFVKTCFEKPINKTSVEEIAKLI